MSFLIFFNEIINLLLFFDIIADIPKEKPTLKGARERYRPGDSVHINCTSAPSKPAASLTWFINDEKV